MRLLHFVDFLHSMVFIRMPCLFDSIIKPIILDHAPMYFFTLHNDELARSLCGRNRVSYLQEVSTYFQAVVNSVPATWTSRLPENCGLNRQKASEQG